MNKTEEKLKITGMTCGHCVTAVSNALKSVTGVENADVNLEQNDATVVYDSEKTTPEEIMGALNDTNYSASLA